LKNLKWRYERELELFKNIQIGKVSLEDHGEVPIEFSQLLICQRQWKLGDSVVVAYSAAVLVNQNSPDFYGLAKDTTIAITYIGGLVTKIQANPHRTPTSRAAFSSMLSNDSKFKLNTARDVDSRAKSA
jgi:hypothetical protein